MLLGVSADDDGLDPGEAPDHLHQPFQSLHGNDLADGHEEGPFLGKARPSPRLLLRWQMFKPAGVDPTWDHARTVSAKSIREGLRVHDERRPRNERGHSEPRESV